MQVLQHISINNSANGTASNAMSSATTSATAPVGPTSPTARSRVTTAPFRRKSWITTPSTTPILGQLRVHVIQAKGIPRNYIMGSKDPYTIISFGTRTIKTKVVRKTLNPIWDHHCRLTINDYEKNYKLYFTVYNNSRYAEHNFIGTCEIEDITQFFDGEQRELWLKLSRGNNGPRTDCSGGSGGQAKWQRTANSDRRDTSSTATPITLDGSNNINNNNNGHVGGVGEGDIAPPTQPTNTDLIQFDEDGDDADEETEEGDEDDEEEYEDAGQDNLILSPNDDSSADDEEDGYRRDEEPDTANEMNQEAPRPGDSVPADQSLLPQRDDPNNNNNINSSSSNNNTEGGKKGVFTRSVGIVKNTTVKAAQSMGKLRKLRRSREDAFPANILSSDTDKDTKDWDPYTSDTREFIEEYSMGKYRSEPTSPTSPPEAAPNKISFTNDNESRPSDSNGQRTANTQKLGKATMFKSKIASLTNFRRRSNSIPSNATQTLPSHAETLPNVHAVTSDGENPDRDTEMFSTAQPEAINNNSSSNNNNNSDTNKAGRMATFKNKWLRYPYRNSTPNSNNNSASTSPAIEFPNDDMAVLGSTPPGSPSSFSSASINNANNGTNPSNAQDPARDSIYKRFYPKMRFSRRDSTGSTGNAKGKTAANRNVNNNKNSRDLGSMHVSLQFVSRSELFQSYAQLLIKLFSTKSEHATLLDRNEFRSLLKTIGNDELTLTTEDADAIFNILVYSRTTANEEVVGSSTTDTEERQLDADDITTLLSQYGHLLEEQVIVKLGEMTDKSSPFVVDDFVLSGFVMQAYSSKNWFKRVRAVLKSNKDYDIASDGLLFVQERESGDLMEEKIPAYVKLALRIMYKNKDRLVGKKRTENILLQLTHNMGRKYSTPQSRKQIEPFIRFFGLKREEFLDPTCESFTTFNEFFYRKLKKDARPITAPNNPNVAVCPADCRILVYENITTSTTLWVKGKNFTLASLFKDEELASLYENGSLVICRLAPQDYHRFHSPVAGVVGPSIHVEGAYYTVNPIAVRTSDVFTVNKRIITSIFSEQFGRVLYIPVGATCVGSIEYTCKEGDVLQKGDEIGYFAYGGSTVLVFFQPGVITFAKDLLVNSMKPLETLVKMGTELGESLLCARHTRGGGGAGSSSNNNNNNNNNGAATEHKQQREDGANNNNNNNGTAVAPPPLLPAAAATGTNNNNNNNSSSSSKSNMHT